MKRSLIALAVAALFSLPVRARTTDVAFTFRMGAGFPGDVNRTHPASILPALLDAANPVRLYGDPVTYGASNAIRGFIAGDTGLTTILGVLVRPYPTQQTTGGMSSALGAAVPPQNAAVADYIREGYVIARCNNFAATQPAKGGAVFVWVTANSGAHVQGGFESVANGVNTIAITNARWMGPTDANGITEMEIMAV